MKGEASLTTSLQGKQCLAAWLHDLLLQAQKHSDGRLYDQRGGLLLKQLHLTPC